MSLFASLSEARQLGSPVLAVFRTALGRDPDRAELEDGVGHLRGGATITDLATAMANHPEFRQRHGNADDDAFVSALCRDAFGTEAPAAGALAMGTALGATRPGFVAAIAAIALAQERFPPLPGLAPGAAPDDPAAYGLWVSAYEEPPPLPGTVPRPGSGPRIHVAMEAGDTEVEALTRTIGSLREQQHGNWQLLLSVQARSAWPRETLARLEAEEPRIRRVEAEELRRAWLDHPAELACCLRPGDRLPPAAFAEVAAVFTDNPGTALVYTDEDVEDETGTRHSPRFKPAFSPDSGDPVGQLAVYRPALVADDDGPIRPDALARAAAAAAEPGAIRHLPGVLCHRATLPASPATPPSARPALPNPVPSVTVVIPTKDRASLLEACVEGVLHRTDYLDLELLIVDNGSTDADAVALLAALARDGRVRVLPFPGPFNFAAMCNAAAAAARGGVLVLLNNDTEVTHPDWLAAMVAQAVRPDVGAVGARLLYPSGTVQHAGILLGPGGRATHVGRHARPEDPGYGGQLARVRDLSAVTGACLAIRAAVWRQVGGMDERLAVAWNDVDLCLRVRNAGLRVLWTPHATLLHREGATRGPDDADPAGAARFRAEQALVVDRWGDAVEHDPFLNPNLLATETGRLCLSAPRERRAAASIGLPA